MRPLSERKENGNIRGGGGVIKEKGLLTSHDGMCF
jgi:hypothetical protein